MGRDTTCKVCGIETDGHYEIGYNNQEECSKCFMDDEVEDDKNYPHEQ